MEAKRLSEKEVRELLRHLSNYYSGIGAKKLAAHVAELDAEIAVRGRALKNACDRFSGDCPLEVGPIPDDCEMVGNDDDYTCRTDRADGDTSGCWVTHYLQEARAEMEDADGSEKTE